MTKPTILLILDGWGYAPDSRGNAESLADMPNINKLIAGYPCAFLHCSGRNVGLPEGFMGNSEVGHMNIGAGRIVYQDMTRIDLAIENNELADNPAIVELMKKTKASGGCVHFMGLLSDGGVHSHINHLYALLKVAKKAGVPAIVHAFMDGRDTSPTSGISYINNIISFMQSIEWGNVGSICGRYYAMDRDKRWERVKVAWDALVHGKSFEGAERGPMAVLEQSYAEKETDEFVKPRVFMEQLTAKMGRSPIVQDGDSVFFYNFRADRARELTSAFIRSEFDGFERGKAPKLASFVSMTKYEDDFDIPAAFTRDSLKNGLGEVVSGLGWQQLRIAETEKYAHVTYFFNGGREEPFSGEERRLVPSPKEVATYDLKPEMSAFEVTDLLLKEWDSGKFNFVVCNLANLDMVGHSGNIPATIKACAAVDTCVGRIAEKVLKSGGRMFLTADHGNAEEMLDPSGSPHTAHTLNPVRFILVEENSKWSLKTEGKLGDIAPTILAAWEQDIPSEMTGNSLLKGRSK